MSSNVAPPRLITPWELRLTASIPLPPFATGALVSVLLIAGTFAFHWLLGMPIRRSGELFGLYDVVRNAILNSIFLGYAIGAIGYGVAGHTRDLRELGVSDIGEEPRVEAARSRVAGAVGVVGGIAIIVVVQQSLGYPLANLLSLPFSWFVLLTLVLSWCVGRAAFAALGGPPPALVSRTSAPIDLLNLRPFQILGRIALRNALLFIVGISLFIPWTLIPGYAVAFTAIMLAALVIPTLALLLPMRGVRRRIHDAKRAELDRTDAELRRVRDGDTEIGAGRLADLYAHRAYVESVREWPFDTSTLTRFALYLLIPLGSWVGSAMVERLVDTFLD